MDSDARSRRPIAIKLIAAVAGGFVLWPILSGLYFFCSIFDVGAPSWKLVVVFWKLFGLTFGDMVFMLLWTGLLVTV